MKSLSGSLWKWKGKILLCMENCYSNWILGSWQHLYSKIGKRGRIWFSPNSSQYTNRQWLKVALVFRFGMRGYCRASACRSIQGRLLVDTRFSVHTPVSLPKPSRARCWIVAVRCWNVAVRVNEEQVLTALAPWSDWSTPLEINPNRRRQTRCSLSGNCCQLLDAEHLLVRMASLCISLLLRNALPNNPLPFFSEV